MVFSDSSKDVHLRTDREDATYLCATCKTDDDGWQYTEILLDHQIWAIRGTLYLVNWYSCPKLTHQLKPGAMKLKSGSVLCGTLNDDLGGNEVTFCLEFYISIKNGQLIWDDISGDVRARMVRYVLDEDAVLKGLVVGLDGKLHVSKLPLGDHYENDDGYIKPKKDGHFQYTATSFWIDEEFRLNARLKYWSCGGGYRLPEYPIYKDIIVSDDGSLSITDPVEYGLFDLRGPFFEFLMKIPIVGYWVAGIDALAGDEDEALKAVAECTYSTVVLAASLAGGFIGGPLGAAVGTAVAAAAAPYVKAAIAQGISDPTMRAELTGVSIFKILTEEVFIIAGVGVAEISSAFEELLTEELTAEGFDTLFSSMGGQLGKKALKKLTDKQMHLIVGTLVEGIKTGKGEDFVRQKIQQYEKPLKDAGNDAKQAVQGAVQKAVQETKKRVRTQIIECVGLQDGEQYIKTVVQGAVQNSLEPIRRAAAKKAEEDARYSELKGQEDSPAASELKQVISNAIKSLTEAADRFIQSVEGQAKLAAENWVPGIVEAAMEGIKQASDQAISGAVQKVGDEVRDDIQDSVQKLQKAAWDSLQQAASEGGQEAQGTIQNDLEGFAKNITQEGEQNIKKMSEAMNDPAQNVHATVQSMANDILDALREEVRGEGAKQSKDIRLYEDTIQRLQNTKQEHMEDFRSRAQKAIQAAEETAMESFRDAEKVVPGAVSLVMLNVKTAAEKAVADAVHAMGDTVHGTVQGVVQKLQETFERNVQEAAQAAQDKIQMEIQETVTKAGNNAVQEGEQKLEEFDVAEEFQAGSLKAMRGGGDGWQGAPDDPVQDILHGVNRLKGLGLGH
ncbi:hypothetical protein CNMCM8980_002949 [Aspergillus fumigatiaffinis]|nr:hypothetical protein CNMCM8980_002949 [Aspergillus fumigatiaffinis]